MPFYEEVKILSIVSNELLDYDNLGCPAESDDESDLNIIFTKEK